jgi:sugar phosphate isomerase/epimerase
MNLALSNLAWDFKDNHNILTKLKNKNINRVEGVFSKIGEWDTISDVNIIEFKKLLDSMGIGMKSIQSIFYNVNCNDIHSKDIVISHIGRLIHYCELLGVEVVVFGSPKLRVGIVDDSLIEVFRIIDSMLVNTNIELSIEPNSKIYGGNYFYTLDEIVNFIDNNSFLKIKTMIDTHNLLLEGCSPSDEYIKYRNYINHIHISEIGLKPIIDTTPHIEFYNTIKKYEYKNTITYEVNMLENFDINIDTFIKIYNPK